MRESANSLNISSLQFSYSSIKFHDAFPRLKILLFLCPLLSPSKRAFLQSYRNSNVSIAKFTSIGAYTFVQIVLYRKFNKMQVSNAESACSNNFGRKNNNNNNKINLASAEKLLRLFDSTDYSIVSS